MTKLDPCLECNACESGTCKAIPDRDTDATCNGTPCFDDESTGANKCFDGLCKKVPVTPCLECNKCDVGDTEVCIPVGVGLTDAPCEGAKCDSGTSTGMEQCDGDGACEIANVMSCGECNECDQGGTEDCTPLGSGATDGDCPGKTCTSATMVATQQCNGFGMCETVDKMDCGPCNKCMNGECVFDVTKPDQEICSTCGQECTKQDDGTGVCQGECPTGETCVAGDVDSADDCVPGTCPTVPCPSGFDCINEECVDSGECGEAKEAICDAAFTKLSGKSDQRAKCCPDTSECVKGDLELTENSVCSTNCGACDLTAIVQGTPMEITEVYCRFGPEPAFFPDLPDCQVVLAMT